MARVGEALETARRAAGITQQELAATAGVTQAALSRYESDLRDPDQATLASLAQALGVTPELLEHAGRMPGALAAEAHMRRRATAPATAWRRTEARLNMLRLHASHLFEEVSMRADRTVPTFDPFDVAPHEAATLVRMQWRMPIGPVRSVISWLESAGVLVVQEPLGRRVDGASQWSGDHPIVLITSDAPVDRRRLTLAHELGHLVLHSEGPGDEAERQANLFAAEFLMPADVIRPQLKNLTLGRLTDLKRQWGVSMQAIIERARELEMLTNEQRTSLYKKMSAKGWRTHEPAGDLIPEETPTLSTAIAEALLERGLSRRDVARLAGYAGPEHMTSFKPPERPLQMVP